MTAQPPDFDELYAADPDPWQVETSWYERRKRDVLLASLPSEHYSTVWEPGCGIGMNTEALAARSGHVVASDSSRHAVRRTQERTAHLGHVEVVLSQLPEMPVDAPVDLLVLAELLYYLPDLPGTIERLWDVTRPGSHVVVQHWAHAPHDAFVSGPQTHRLVAEHAASTGARRLVTHQEQDFLLDVYEVTR